MMATYIMLRNGRQQDITEHLTHYKPKTYTFKNVKLRNLNLNSLTYASNSYLGIYWDISKCIILSSVIDDESYFLYIYSVFLCQGECMPHKGWHHWDIMSKTPNLTPFTLSHCPDTGPANPIFFLKPLRAEHQTGQQVLCSKSFLRPHQCLIWGLVLKYVWTDRQLTWAREILKNAGRHTRSNAGHGMPNVILKKLFCTWNVTVLLKMFQP